MNRNITSIIVSIIYAISAYLIIRYALPHDTPIVINTIIPVGVTVILILFKYVFKYDYFDKNNVNE